MRFLALETAGDTCSVAVADDTTLLSAYHFRHERQLTERLPGIVQFVLSDRALTFDDLEGYAVGLGPGSFTGIRVGVTLIKTIAHITGRPVVGVSALDTLAFAQHPAPWEAIAAVAPTRHTESVVALYGRGTHTPAVGPVVMLNSEIAAALAAFAPHAGLCLVVGEVAGKIRDAAPPPANITFLTQSVGASALVALAAARFGVGDTDDVDSLVPLYVTPTPVG